MKGPMADAMIPSALNYLKSVGNIPEFTMPLKQDAGLMLVIMESIASSKFSLSCSLVTGNAPTSFHNSELSSSVEINLLNTCCYNSAKRLQVDDNNEGLVGSKKRLKTFEDTHNTQKINQSVEIDETEIDTVVLREIMDFILLSDKIGVEIRVFFKTD